MSKPYITVGELLAKLQKLPADAEVTGVVARPLDANDRSNKGYLCLVFCRKNGETDKTVFAYTFSKGDE